MMYVKRSLSINRFTRSLLFIFTGVLAGLVFILPFSGAHPEPNVAYSYSGGRVSDSSDSGGTSSDDDSGGGSVVGYSGGMAKQFELDIGSVQSGGSSSDSGPIIGYGGALLNPEIGVLEVLDQGLDLLDESIDEFSEVTDIEHNFRKFNTPFTITDNELSSARLSIIRSLTSSPQWAGENLEYVKSISNLEMSKLRHSENVNGHDFFAYGGISILATPDPAADSLPNLIEDVQVSGYCQSGGDVCSVAIDFRKANRIESYGPHSPGYSFQRDALLGLHFP